jgi:hypothetical protein
LPLLRRKVIHGDQYSKSDEGLQDDPRKSLTLSEIVKSVKRNRHVSVFRDAAYMRALQGLNERGRTGRSPSTSVSRPSPLTPSLIYPLDDSIFERRSKHEPWWLRLNGGEPLPKPARQFRTPADWRDVSDTLHIHYLHLALETLGPIHGFTLRLDDAVEAQAAAQPDALGWLSRRIARRLQDALGRPVQCYCVLEQDDRRKLHVHGEMGIVDHNGIAVKRDRAKARKALRLAGGEFLTVRQFQAHVPPDAPDSGWSGYLAKDFTFFGPIVRPWLTSVGSRYAPGFGGDQISRTKILGALAVSIYNEHRALVMRSS